MTTVIFGGSGFIGRRLTEKLAERGERVVCADISPPTGAERNGPADHVRADLTRFDSVMATMLEFRPTRAINLAYMMNFAAEPHSTFVLNAGGVDNFLEAARLAEVDHVVMSSSLAVNGKQREFGEVEVTEAHPLRGVEDNAYAAQKIFNEYQARDYREKHGMNITVIRPSNVSGHDKIFGSSDHVRIITDPAQGIAIELPFRDIMRNIVYVDDVAEVFARIALATPRHQTYNTGGNTVSLGDLAGLVTSVVPSARIQFHEEFGGRDGCTNYLISNERLRQEFGFEPRSAEAIVEMIVKQSASNAGSAAE
ncbi:NAD(P)-dependent oxidoreductase [Citricoccus sp. NPDC055426]|uniref:NAD-dependent epimerase/dehydratase family protein n=1 Tax=Citricoccus sp. NPDC055426 TaxID=3155536 RepID=UPI0034323AC2